MLKTAAVALMHPVLTSDAKYLHQYGYALRWAAGVAERTGRDKIAARYRARAYYLRTLVR